MGHLPTFTDNPYVLANMSERYNVALRKLAKQYTLQVIDLEKWSKTALRPRDKYFFDAVHLHKKGQEMIGVYMAIELHSLLQQHE
jgi:lysophospholipase L1-like esterase